MRPTITKIKRRRKVLKKLWFRYCSARNKLFDYYWNKWAKDIAKLFSRKYKVRFSDIETEASIGLLKAIEYNRVKVGYDDSGFKHYAIDAIRTSILDGIKALRGVDVTHTKMNKMAEIFKKDINFSRMKRIHDEVQVIREYIDRLEPFEKNLIYRKYFLGETFVEISKDLGISQSVLSLKCKDIINSMKETTGVGPIT